MIGTNNEFRLFCRILGQSNIFSVKIGKSETVYYLKKAIRKRKEPELDHLAIDALSVWKLSPPIPSVEIDAKLGHVQNPEEIPGIEVEAFKEMSQLFESAPPEHLHIIVEVPHTPSRKHSRLSQVEEDTRATKRERIAQPIIERKWTVNGAIREIDKAGCYYLDPGTQDESEQCLNMVSARQFVLLWGSRASGKTTRLFWLRKELSERGYQALYISFEHINYRRDISTFWESLGNAVHRAASKINLQFSDRLKRASSQDDFLEPFREQSSKRTVVLIIDEFGELYHAKPEIRDDCLRGFREIRNNSDAYAIRSIIAAGTFGIVYLNPSTFVSPFNVGSHVRNPYFSLDETRKLFRAFELDNQITIDDAVVKDIWAKSNGHPAMVCLCGRTINKFLLSLIDDSANLSYRNWQQFPVGELYNGISAYNTFSSMLMSLSRPQAKASVALLRSRFAGFLDEVVLKNQAEQDLGNILTSEGVLLKPDPARPRYYMASPFVDGLIRNNLIPQLFPDSPSSAPPQDGKGLHVLATLIESLKFFNKTLIHLAASCSYKKVIIPNVPNGYVPRESVYDTELMRILSSWLQNRYDWSVIGQWHLQNDMKNSNIVIKKEEEDLPIVLELLATGDMGCVKSHIQKTLEYMALLSAKAAWVVHFTCEQDYQPVWQSDVELSEGVNVVHFAHDLEFKKVVMSARWKDYAGNIHLEDGQLLVV